MWDKQHEKIGNPHKLGYRKSHADLHNTNRSREHGEVQYVNSTIGTNDIVELSRTILRWLHGRTRNYILDCPMATTVMCVMVLLELLDSDLGSGAFVDLLIL